MDKKIIQIIPAKKLEWGETAGKEMTWNEARSWCKNKGDGWRLPTRLELLQAFDGGVVGFRKDDYWSSTETFATIAWYQNFSTGAQYRSAKTFSSYVRCVRIN